ncbi:hypothetical protein N9L76_09520 [bacterium]|nr:hypothetical protein [bacterium]
MRGSRRLVRELYSHLAKPCTSRFDVPRNNALPVSWAKQPRSFASEPISGVTTTQLVNITQLKPTCGSTPTLGDRPVIHHRMQSDLPTCLTDSKKFNHRRVESKLV